MTTAYHQDGPLRAKRAFFELPHGKGQIFPQWLMWILFSAGLAISLTMILRSQVWGHQFEFLVLGWTFAAEGRWLPFGCTVTGGGVYPGGLTSLLFGLPMSIWMDFRSPSLLVLVSHVVAYFILDRSLREFLSVRERQLFFIFYWLNPWRIYFSAHGWNIDWLFIVGAMHFWSAMRLRKYPGFAPTLIHVLMIGAAAQLHASFVILFLLTLILWGGGYLRLRWSACFLGGFIFILSLVPWMLEAMEHPEVLPTGGNTPGRGLFVLYPILRGVLYWFRYGSLLAGRRMTEFDFTPAFGEQADAVLMPLSHLLTYGLAPITLILVIMANWWLWRRAGPWRLRFTGEQSNREWLIGFIRITFLASLISFALSPQTIVMWHVLIVMHIALLPQVLWMEALWTGSRGVILKRALCCYIPATLVFLVAIACAAQMFRTGGRNAAVLQVREHYPMIDELGITGRTPIIITEFGASLDMIDMAHRKRSGELYEE